MSGGLQQYGATPARPAPKPGGRQFLTFFLDVEEYGVEIQKVHEIIGMLPVTRVPRTPLFVRGVVNLRGKVIPIVDLRLKFGMERVEATASTCIIVVELRGFHMGLVVDRVSEVTSLAPDDIQESPSFGEDVHTEYLLGIGKAGERIKLLLDIERVLSSGDVIELRGLGS